MISKLNLLRLATTLLYAGPLLAGMTGLGWMLVPVFALLFMTWLLFLRPETWPGAAHRGPAPGESLVTLFAEGAAQMLLVAVCFGIGRGIAGVAGLTAMVPFWYPVVISCTAILLGRLAWNPADVAEIDSRA